MPPRTSAQPSGRHARRTHTVSSVRTPTNSATDTKAGGDWQIATISVSIPTQSTQDLHRLVTGSRNPPFIIVPASARLPSFTCLLVQSRTGAIPLHRLSPPCVRPGPSLPGLKSFSEAFISIHTCDRFCGCLGSWSPFPPTALGRRRFFASSFPMHAFAPDHPHPIALDVSHAQSCC